jgi:hypothetical protein
MQSSGGLLAPISASFIACEGSSATDAQIRLLQRAKTQLVDDGTLACDRELPLRQLQTAGIQRYVGRASVNFTVRRAPLPAYQGKGRKPIYDAMIRPLPPMAYPTISL